MIALRTEDIANKPAVILNRKDIDFLELYKLVGLSYYDQTKIIKQQLREKYGNKRIDWLKLAVQNGRNAREAILGYAYAEKQIRRQWELNDLARSL